MPENKKVTTAIFRVFDEMGLWPLFPSGLDRPKFGYGSLGFKTFLGLLAVLNIHGEL